MDVVTIRMEPELVDSLEAEADAQGFSNRTEYIRFLLRNRHVIEENTSASSPNTDGASDPNTGEYASLQERIGELEEEFKMLTEAHAEPAFENEFEPEFEEEDQIDVEEEFEPDYETEAEIEGDSDTARVEAIEDILDGWPPRTVQRREDKREVAVTVLEYLRSDEGPLSGSNFQELLFDADDWELSADTWWRNYARPALREAVDHGLVEYREGHHDYVWRGGGRDSDVYDPTDEF